MTDANVVLGRLNPEHLVGGRVRVHREKAASAVAVLAAQLGVSSEEAALGIVDVVNSNMMEAIRVVSVERGYDYRDCVLVAFGGAGPLHAAEVASEMGFSTVLIPPAPGILCALGLLLADYRVDFTHTHIFPAEEHNQAIIRAVFAELQSRAEEWGGRQGIHMENANYNKSIYMRYKGQSYQLPVVATTLEAPSDVTALVTKFHEAHKKTYGYSQRQSAVETVDFHLTAVIPVPRPKLFADSSEGGLNELAEAVVGNREVFFHSGPSPVLTPVYWRDRLPPCKFAGPAIIEQIDSTTVVPPEAETEIDMLGNVTITLVGQQPR